MSNYSNILLNTTLSYGKLFVDSFHYNRIGSFNIRILHHINDMTILILSLIVNAILALLVATERNKTLNAYKRVLLQNCVIDMTQTIVAAMVELQFEFSEGYLVFKINGILRHFPMRAHYFILSLFTVTCSSMVNSVPVMFYFRYMLVVKGKTMSNWAITKITALPIFAALLEGASLMAATGAYDSQRDMMCQRLLKHPIWWEPGTRSANNKCMLSNLMSPFFAFFMIWVLFLDTAIYTVMSYCTYGIYREMYSGDVRSVSKQTSKLQKQMNWMLIAQMCMPLITAIIPVLVFVFFPLLKIDVPGAGIAVVTAWSWVPLISPITTICLVGRFRGRLISVLLGGRRRVDSTVIAIDHSSAHTLTELT